MNGDAGGGAFFLLVPILRIALRSVHSPFFDGALKCLTDHCAPGERLPRSAIFDLLYLVLSHSPALKSVISHCPFTGAQCDVFSEVPSWVL